MTIENTEFEKLFYTPFLRFKVPDFEDLNARLIAEGKALREQDEGVAKSNRNGWHSKGNLFKQKAPAIQVLHKLARQSVVEATMKIKAKPKDSKAKVTLFAWMNVNPPGGYNVPHTHPGAHWSGVYYVSQPEIEKGNSGMIEFIDPRSDLPNWRVLNSPAFSQKKKLRPQPGEIVLFPSYLVHWVYPNEADDDRITIAFNATFK